MNGKLFLMAVVLLAHVVSNVCFAQDEVQIPKDSLPQPVNRHLLSKFNDYIVSNVTKLIDETGEAHYKLVARKEKTGEGRITVLISRLTYDSTGKLLSKQKQKEIYYTGTEVIPKPSPANDGHDHHH